MRATDTSAPLDRDRLELGPLVPLLLAAGILLAGNGIQGTLVALRGAEEGFSAGAIGIAGLTYFAGFALGCWRVPALLSSIGHLRAFSALSAVAATSALLLVVFIDEVAWALLRGVSGFCFAGLFATIESWLQGAVHNRQRGRLLSIYRIIDLGFVIGGQLLIPLIGIAGFTLFAVLTAALALSAVPVSLADRSNPTPPPRVAFDPLAVWRLSPIASITCVATGMTVAAFRLIGPVYAREAGFALDDIAFFMSAGIAGGAVLQYPLGALSDRIDRRTVLALATAGAAFAGIAVVAADGGRAATLVGVFLFGGFSLPLYSLAAAHANDHAAADGHVGATAGLLMYFALGAMVGPPVSSLMIDALGPRGLFVFTTAVHGSLVLATLVRMRARGPVPRDEQRPFVALLRTSAAFGRRGRRKE